MSKEAETDICGICREELTEATKIQECSHVFCFACIGKWCNISNSCPLCQTRFFQLCRIAEPNHKDKEVQAKTKTGNNVVVSVKNVDKRQENWMQVMEEYDSEEISIHTDSEEDEDDEALGSEGDRYEPDFVSANALFEKVQSKKNNLSFDYTFTFLFL